MSTKIKLFSTIGAFFLILGLMVMGVFASPVVQVNLGGQISFNAKNVYAQVDGTISGSKEDPTLGTLVFKEGRTSDEQTEFETAEGTWKDCDLVFTDAGAMITITVKITNLADRPLYAKVSPIATMSADITADMFYTDLDENTADTDYTAGELINLGEKDSETDTKYIKLTLTVNSLNNSLDGNWGFDIDLMNDEPVVEEEIFTETY